MTMVKKSSIRTLILTLQSKSFFSSFQRVWNLMNLVSVLFVFFVVSLLSNYFKIIFIMEFKDKIDFLNGIIAMLPDCIGLSVKRYIACQFALESGFGKSPSACCNNNYCGMKVPSFRISLVRNLDEKASLPLLAASFHVFVIIFFGCSIINSVVLS